MFVETLNTDFLLFLKGKICPYQQHFTQNNLYAAKSNAHRCLLFNSDYLDHIWYISFVPLLGMLQLGSLVR